MKTFNELGLNEKLIKGLSKKNITKPTKVQSLTIEKILDHKDILVNSETGSGKTLAYLLPMFEKINTDKKDPQVLVLAPTHELVMQMYILSKTISEFSVKLSNLSFSKKQVNCVKLLR